MKKLFSFLYGSIFWLWNLIFLITVYVGFLPGLGSMLFAAIVAGEIPVTFVVSLAGLIGVPTLSTIVGGLKLRRHPVLLMRLFYGVEAPLFVLCLLRLFLIREMTPASIQILGTFVFCIFIFGVELLWGDASRRPVLAWLQLISHSLMLIMGVYVSVLLTFYVVPALWTFVYHFFQFRWAIELGYLFTTQPFTTMWWSGVSFLLASFSCTLFFAMPLVMVTLYTRSWWRVASAFGTRRGHMRAGAATGGVAIAWFLIFVALQQQPQIKAFALLEPPAQTDASRQALLANTHTIREGLLNAYLSSYRYIGSWEESNQLREMYRSVFSMAEPQAQFWQDFHNHWISPFLYNGSRSDSEKAASLYAEFFDAPIQRAERSAIQHALQSTVERDAVQAGLLNINQEVVWLAQQKVTVQEHGDWAEIELYEHYQNPTNQDQEIFYYFSLPESAVITGLWLGDSPDRSNRFPFVVSPRGAAQQVYNDEVERSNTFMAEDPALLEQVGPRQYRLRVFPIPARESTEKPGNLHLWMTYNVMAQANGWTLPNLSEKRNIFWTKDTLHQRNGRTVQLAKTEWLEPTLPVQHHTAAQTHTVLLPEGYQVVAKPLRSQDYMMPKAKRLALIVDGSRSMASHRRELVKTVQWLKQHASNNDVDFYLTASAGAQPKRIDEWHQFNPTQTVFYGTLQLPDLLHQFARLQGNTSYDAVLLVTDQGSYELSKPNEAEKLPALTAPLWTVHLGGTFPAAYDDATLELIHQTQGGVATDVATVLQQLATQASLGESIASITDGYAWMVSTPPELTSSLPVALEVVQTSPQPVNASEGDFTPLAARQLILKWSREQDMTQLETLDQVHAIAKSTEIVTPYSSMLVLVNDRQRELLKQAEASSDRFNREIESGNDELTQPNNPLNAVAVPEPGNVVGMGALAIGFLVFAKRRSRSTTARSPLTRM
ncbi:TIGR02921 family PEP-CTERM protein [Oculatella sp. LEGE 06141]|uniref:TIGR02921 family PEP-CTERM protein n=1 Tax=Oculatella sp. LEGE 06141 TaxID=1828648 RepID=UPI001880FEDE|nr:TIGR02921 family PEP-CTERM protein [Oculatella sp. LEGE 06141]MBE9179087.1 TIGR02921 family PEP-CTERM protein [Oculatella sp. LEGE 06141]